MCTKGVLVRVLINTVDWHSINSSINTKLLVDSWHSVDQRILINTLRPICKNWLTLDRLSTEMLINALK